MFEIRLFLMNATDIETEFFMNESFFTGDGRYSFLIFLQLFWTVLKKSLKIQLQKNRISGMKKDSFIKKNSVLKSVA